MVYMWYFLEIKDLFPENVLLLCCHFNPSRIGLFLMITLMITTRGVFLVNEKLPLIVM